MKDYIAEFKEFQLSPVDLPNFENSEKFAQNFKRCTIYKDVNTTYSNSSNTDGPVRQDK